MRTTTHNKQSTYNNWRSRICIITELFLIRPETSTKYKIQVSFLDHKLFRTPHYWLITELNRCVGSLYVHTYFCRDSFGLHSLIAVSAMGQISPPFELHGSNLLSNDPSSVSLEFMVFRQNPSGPFCLDCLDSSKCQSGYVQIYLGLSDWLFQDWLSRFSQNSPTNSSTTNSNVIEWLIGSLWSMSICTTSMLTI